MHNRDFLPRHYPQVTTKFFFMRARSSTSNRVDVHSWSWLIQASAVNLLSLVVCRVFPFVIALGESGGGGDLGGVAMAPEKKKKKSKPS